MIAVRHRFHGHASLSYLHTKGSVVRGQSISLKYIENRTKQYYRAAVIVSKKVHKSAVVRNHIRRRVYEIIRQNVQPATAVDFAVLVYDAKFATTAAEELQSTVGGLLRKAKLT